jgi:hypothetical protein
MGYKIGDSLFDPTTPGDLVHDDGNDVLSFSSSSVDLVNYKDDVFLLSFIPVDSDQDNANIMSDWLDYLISIEDEFKNASANYQIIAVLYYNGGAIDQFFDPSSQIAGTPNFLLMNNQGWTRPTGEDSLAKACLENGFQDDTSFSAPLAGITMFSFLLDANFRICDKWTTNTSNTANPNPISFRRLRLAVDLEIGGTLSDGASTRIMFPGLTDQDGNRITGEININNTAGSFAYSYQNFDAAKLQSITPASGSYSVLDPVEIVFKENVNGMDDAGSYEVSLQPMTINPGMIAFDSADSKFSMAVNFILARKQNLEASKVQILYAVPDEHSDIGKIGPRDVEVVFSKPVSGTAIGTNISFGGAAIGGTPPSCDVHYRYEDTGTFPFPKNVGKVEDVATLSIDDDLADGSFLIHLDENIVDWDANLLVGNYKGDTQQDFHTLGFNGPVITSPNTAGPIGVVLESAFDALTVDFSDIVCKSTTAYTEALAALNAANVNPTNGDPLALTMPAFDVPTPAVGYTLQLEADPQSSQPGSLAGDGACSLTFLDVMDEYRNPLRGTVVIQYDVDTIHPTISTIKSTDSNGHYNSGDIAIEVTFSEDVIITGSIILELNVFNEETSVTVTIEEADKKTGTDDVYEKDYPISGGDTSGDQTLRVTNVDLNGATIVDAKGNALVSTAIGENIHEGSAATIKSIIIDTISPYLSSIVGVPAAGDIGPDSTIVFALTFNEPVRISGATPSVDLALGGSRTAPFPTTGTGTAVSYNGNDYYTEYEVEFDILGSTAGGGLSYEGIALNGGTIRDRAGNDFSSTTVPTESLSALVIDVDGPCIDQITTSATAGAYPTYSNIGIAVQFNEPVILSGGFLRVEMNTGAKVEVFAYAYPSTTLFGTYTVKPGQSTPSGQALTVTGIDLWSPTGITTTLTDVVGNSANLGLCSGLLPTFTGITVTESATDLAHHVILLLDVSGSMGSNVTIETETRPKIEYTRAAVIRFLEKLNTDFITSDDLYGVVLYESKSHPTNSPLPNDPQLLSTTDAIDLLNNDVLLLDAEGGTAMGAGLANALNLLSYQENPQTHGKARYIIMFADGQQNGTPNIIFESDLSQFSINTTGGSASSSIPSGMGQIIVQKDEPSTFPIHTIGIGYHGTWLETLMKISSVSGGSFSANDDVWDTVSVWPGVENALDRLIQLIYAGNSPQIHSILRGTIEPSSNNQTEVFHINRSVVKLLVTLSWIGDTPVDFDLYKDGMRIAPAETRNGPNHKTVYVDLDTVNVPRLDTSIFHRLEMLIARLESMLRSGLSHIYRELPIDLIAEAGTIGIVNGFDRVGNWDVRIKRENAEASSPSVPYNLSVLIDDKEIQIGNTDFGSFFITGQSLPIEFFAGNDRMPFTHIERLSIKVEKPAHAIGNIIAENTRLIQEIVRMAAFKKSGEDDIIKHIYSHPTIKKLMGKKRTEVVDFGKSNSPNLRDENGCFAISYRNLTVPGIYSVTCNLSAWNRRQGRVTRTIPLTYNVKSRADRANSLIQAALDSDNLFVTITPKDRCGNYLGPGFTKDIVFTLAGAAKKTVKDNMDGTYTVDVRLENGQKPNGMLLRIRMAEAVLYSDRVEKILRVSNNLNNVSEPLAPRIKKSEE